jgi:hypothetical protein
MATATLMLRRRPGRGQQLSSAFGGGAALADLDGDNDADALVANVGAPSQVWRNEGISGVRTLYQIRDGVMAGTARGEHYIALYTTHSPEILSLILADREPFDTGYTTLMRWLPGLQTLVDGSGGGAIITQPQVDALDGFLGDLSEKGSADLRQTIAAERDALPALDSFVGQTMAEARGGILGDLAHARYLPVVTPADAKALGVAQPPERGSKATPACFILCYLIPGYCRPARVRPHASSRSPAHLGGGELQ